MRILLVGNYLPDAQQSMQRYADWLEQGLGRNGHQVRQIKPKACFSRLARHAGLKKYLGYIDKYILFPPFLWICSRHFDLVHICDQSNSMYLDCVGGCARLITCHDLLAIRQARAEVDAPRVGWTGRILQRWILHGLRRAPLLACVSTRSMEDAMVLTGLAAERMAVTLHATNWPYRAGVPMADSLRERLGLQRGERYLFHVGGNQWYKNRPGVLRIFAALRKCKGHDRLRLVMAGKPWYEPMREVVERERLQEAVIDAGTVTNEELEQLYGGAHALLFPSLEEGFGWPLIEAQACGCAVITTNRAPMTEVAGEGAIYVDPAEEQRAAEAIAAAWADLDRVRQKGFENLARFSEDAVLARYEQLYRRTRMRSVNRR